MLKRRRRIRRLLAGCICLALCAAGIYAVPKIIRFMTGRTGDYTYVLLADGTAEIRQYYGNEAEVTIPSSLDGHAVSRIGMKSFGWRINIKRLTIPQSVTVIDDGAFMGCVRLSGIEMPEGVTTIGEEAFRGCSSLTGLHLPDTVTAIGSRAFEGCSNLSEIRIPDNAVLIGANPVSACPNLKRILFSSDHPSLKNVDGNLCDQTGTVLICCAQDTTDPVYVIPSGITAIGECAFQRKTHLKEVILPDGIAEIRDHAFDGCSGLQDITIPSGVTVLGNSVFSECTSLERAVLPDGLTEIGYLAFFNCFSMTRLRIPASVTNIDDGAFIGCRNLTIEAEPGSFAEAYCIRNGLRYN